MKSAIKDMHEIYTDTIAALSIGLASPEAIKSWSSGVVTRPDTINYKTQRPETDGLFCQRIFGPIKDYECACGLHKQESHKGIRCDKCGVLVAPASVRRERMGHIELCVPVGHIWFTRGNSSILAKLLGMKQKDIDAVLNYAEYIVVSAGENTDLVKCQTLTNEEYILAEDKWDTDFKAMKGAAGIKQILMNINLDEMCDTLMEKYRNATSKQARQKIYTQLSVAKSFRDSGNRPEWMILDNIPVLPPELRPMAQMSSGAFAVSDINELYKQVIVRNNRLNGMIEKGAPSLVLENESRMLQQAVDCLFDNAKVPQMNRARGTNKRELKSLAEALSGKSGRFRQNLLGKRVDYSGRSVICVEPALKIWQCGLPKPMALELYKPYVAKRLSEMKECSLRAALHSIERKDTEVWDVLEEVIKDRPVFLNRAPTLHRLGIQAFYPVLVEGNAIKLNPLVCTAFNADFDGDQMAVHLPITDKAVEECRTIMLSSNNLLKPSDGKPVAVPSQDMVLGAYYLTMEKDTEADNKMVFRDMAEVELAFANKDITLHTKIKVRRVLLTENGEESRIVPTTYGKLIFNSVVPQDLGFVDRTDPENRFKYEIDFLVKKKQLSSIIERCISKHGMHIASDVLDNLKALGYKYSTIAGITANVFDAVIPDEKKAIVSTAEEETSVLTKAYLHGMCSKEEKSRLFVEIWDGATKEITDKLEQNFDAVNNPIHMMADSGARGSMAQLRQLAGMRGLIANTSGATIEMPIKSNYREGLSTLEYFIAARGARKGLADTALRTADSGYLTRRLVDASHSSVIVEEDCGSQDGIIVKDIVYSGNVIEPLAERLVGRYLTEDFEKGDIRVSKGKMLTEEDANLIVSTGVTEIKVRSALTCHSTEGICAKCYGKHLGTNKRAELGDAVGVVAAQSIGEPGTQLTMRTFHTGGVASEADITQGLPRVEELFENRPPKNKAIIAEISGTVSFTQGKKLPNLVITNDSNSVAYPIPFNIRPIVKEGDTVNVGDKLTDGIIRPSELLAIKGEAATYDYVINEIQSVYRTQGVDINDKHIEVILKHLMSKVKITDSGDSKLLVNSTCSRTKLHKLNKMLEAKGKSPVLYEPMLEGLTKVGTRADGFLSAASFQETSKVLSEAAIRGELDELNGLKENVMVGKLIPVGTAVSLADTE